MLLSFFAFDNLQKLFYSFEVDILKIFDPLKKMFEHIHN